MNRLRRWSLNLSAACLLLAVPSFMSAQATAPAKDTKSTGKKGGKSAPAQPVDLNAASQAELESVPGIGTATAKKIIAGRPYSSVADLSKAGLSAKQVQGLSSMVKVGNPPPAKPSPSATMAPAKPATTPATPAATTTMAKPQTTTAGTQSCAADMVWVNTETKVYHKSGDRYFANTKHGKCMAEADAQKAGYHLSKQKQ